MMRYDETEIIVRFQEVDEWGIAWHGHYIGWFEVGRMELLRKFDLLPRQFSAMGYIAPVVNLKCDFKEPALSGDHLVIRTTVLKPEKAALTFCFEIYRKEDQKLLAKGETTQVLMTTDGKLLYYIPNEIKDKIDSMIQYLNQP
jgi:acyl-CoA thioester hydrolase